MIFSPSRIRIRHGIAIVLLVALASQASSATFTVDSTADEPDATPGDGICAAASGACTLRAATKETFWLAGHDTVIVPAGSYLVDSSLQLSEVTILGAGRDVTIVERVSGTGPVFFVSYISTIDGVEVTGSIATTWGIEVNSFLTLTSSRVIGSAVAGVLCRGSGHVLAGFDMIDTEVVGNVALGVYASACLATITDSVVAQNGWRGIQVEDGGLLWISEVIIERSEVSQNLQGGILMLGNVSVELTESTVSENEASSGGGIVLDDCGTLRATNSTISGNRATDSGGGIFRAGGLCGSSSLSNTTVADNVADSDNNGSGDGGGVFDLAPSGSEFELRNSIIADNRDRSGEAPDCVGNGMLASAGFNLIGDSTGCVLAGDTSDDRFDVEPKLEGLASNGGTTRTHALRHGSPAVNAVAAGECTTAAGAPVAFDQRGTERPYNIRCDSGAYELDSEPGLPTLGIWGRLAFAGTLIALAIIRLRGPRLGPARS